MTTQVVAALAVLLFFWAVVSGALARRNITGPLVFAVAGYVLSNPDWGPFAVDLETSSIHVIAEATLALLLFSDASRVNVTALRRDASIPTRLLGLGLPLSVVIGAVLAALLLDLPWALAGFVGATLAPTDAALSLQVINDERIPMRLRRALNVESGLNDGIATPIVSIMLAVAAGELGPVSESASIEIGIALRDLGIGAGIGLVVGLGGAVALNHATRLRWIAPGGTRLAVLALALGALALTLAAGGNGFIAAFIAGAAFGATADRNALDLERTNELPELGGELLALVVWFLFGATMLPLAFELTNPELVLYVVLSLTVIRMVPVALSLLGAGLDRPTTVFLAWFGPRGLASVVFALLALEELGETNDAANLAVAAVAWTVAASIVLHGATAGPGGRRYVQLEQADAGPGSTMPLPRRSHFVPYPAPISEPSSPTRFSRS